MVHKFIIYDHETHPIWMPVYRAKFEALGKTNGAYTYSQDIKKYHLPIILQEIAKTEYEYTLISTVGRLSPGIVPPETKLIIYYLHENTLREIPRIKTLMSWYKGKIIFITARIENVREIQKLGISAIHLPLSIETSAIAKYAKSEKYADKRVLYFGNTYLGKGGSLSQVKESFINKGWIFDQISFNTFNGGQSLTRGQIFDIIAKYKYGIGEGRCVLEMNALGLRTLVCASKNQGIFTNDDDFTLQRAHNFSDGKIWTFSPDINECIEYFDKAIVKTIDVQDVLPILKEQLERVLL